MIPDAGKILLVDVQTSHTAPESFNIGLYTNTFSWGPSTGLGSIVEPTQTGYAQQPAGSFNAATINGSGQASATPTAPITFTNNDVSTPIVAQGYFWVGASSGALYGGNPFATPITIPPGGGTQQFMPDFLGYTL